MYLTKRSGVAATVAHNEAGQGLPSLLTHLMTVIQASAEHTTRISSYDHDRDEVDGEWNEERAKETVEAGDPNEWSHDCDRQPIDILVCDMQFRAILSHFTHSHSRILIG